MKRRNYVAVSFRIDSVNKTTANGISFYLGTGNTPIQFIDDSADKKKSSAVKTNDSAAVQGHFMKKSFTASLGDPNFQFNFAVSEIEKLSLGQPQEVNDASKVCNIENSCNDPTIGNASNSKNVENPSQQNSKSPFIKSKLFTSNNSFKFNFTID